MQDPREELRKMLTDKYPLTEVEADMTDDFLRAKQGLGPADRRAAQGVQDMLTRTAELVAEKKKLLDAMADAVASPERLAMLEQQLADLNRELHIAGARSEEYRTQEQGLN